MKNFLITLMLVVAVSAATFGAFYAVNREPAELRRAAAQGDALAWLRAEFRLDDRQFAEIRMMHADFERACGERCAAIRAARGRAAPASEVLAMENGCVRMMIAHFQRVASVMAPAEGARYLALVLPRIHDYDHHGAPTVQVHS